MKFHTGDEVALPTEFPGEDSSGDPQASSTQTGHKQESPAEAERQAEKPPGGSVDEPSPETEKPSQLAGAS